MFKEGKSVVAHPIRVTYKVLNYQAGSAKHQGDSIEDQAGSTDDQVGSNVGQVDPNDQVRSNVGQVDPNDQAVSLQAGFSVSSRNFKKAVHRNRIKRLLRESYRKQKSTFLELLKKEGAHFSIAIFIIYTGKELPAYDFVDEKMKLALKKLTDQIR